MKPSIVLFACLGVATLALSGRSFLQGSAPEAPPALPADLAVQPVELLAAHEFVLERPATHWYRAERPTYTQGVVLVLHASPDLVLPRQTYEPVLYVGAETAERVNHGGDSGNLVVVVPDLDLAGLADAPIFFGTPELPERVTAEVARAERDAALAGGAAAPGATRVAQVRGPAFEASDDVDLRAVASDLVARFAPTEVDVIEGLRAPRIGR